MIFSIPPSFSRKITAVFPEGAEWLKSLPALIADFGRRWSLTVLRPFENLSYNYVAPAIRADGAQAVLKLGVPSPELSSEIAALKFYDGRGAVRLLEADPERGAMLLERLTPGKPLTDLEDDAQATLSAAGVMAELHSPAPPEGAFWGVERWFESLREYRQRFAGGGGPLPGALVDRAHRLYTRLASTMAAPVLLHGDLHHDNILSSGQGHWAAIDPKGLIGEAVFEAGALLRNPLPGLLQAPDPRRTLTRRIDILVERLGFDRERLASWALAQAVLSVCWSLEESDDGWPEMIACAEILESICKP